MIVLDASVVVALFDPADAHHAVARRLIADQVEDGFVMHGLTVAEVLIGHARLGRGQERFDDLASVGITVADVPADEPLLLAELRAATSLKLPDCCVLAVALRGSMPLATLDRRLSAVARDRGLETLEG